MKISERLTTGAVWFVLVAVLIAGAWARLKGLGTWPFAVDEFLTAASVANILNGGLPAFECGGYYVRGLPYQYLAAPLIYSGLEPEFSLRILSALFSYLALIPLFLLVHRVAGRFAAASAVILMCLSLWEIEFARFGRMYAMFQAVFLTYLWVLIRIMVDNKRNLLPHLYALSLLGLLVWEGGVALLVLNFAPHLLRVELKSLSRFAPAIGCLAFGGIFLAVDFRRMGGETLPEGFVPVASDSSAPLDYALALWPQLMREPLWIAAWLAIAVLSMAGAIYALVRRSSRRTEQLPTFFILVYVTTVVLALLHLFGAIAFLVAAALLFRWFDPRTLNRGDWWHLVWPLLTVALASTVFWLAFAYLGQPSADASEAAQSLRRIVVAIAKFPNVLDTVVLPWASAIPSTSLLFVAAGIAGFWFALQERSYSADLRVWCLAALVVIALASVASTKYHETRYSFALLSLGYMFAASAMYLLVSRLVQGVALRGLLQAVVIGSVVLVGDDFSMRHIKDVDTPLYNFRMQMSEARRAMYYSRDDFRSPAEYVNESVDRNDQVITFSSPSSAYLKRLDAIYRDAQSLEFPAISCARGTVERWTNAPMITSPSALETYIAATGGDTWVVVSEDKWKRYGRVPDSHIVERCMSGIDGRIHVLRVGSKASGLKCKTDG